MDLKFGKKLASEVGLHLYRFGESPSSYEFGYRADDVHKLLENAQTVIRFKAIGDRWGSWEQLNALNGGLAEQEGILIGIKSIQKDTAEQILLDLVSGDYAAFNIVQRAEKLLASKKLLK